VLRQWITIPPQFELRAFVFDRKLTALSQYYDNAYFYELIANKERILEVVQQCFEAIKDICPVSRRSARRAAPEKQRRAMPAVEPALNHSDMQPRWSRRSTPSTLRCSSRRARRTSSSSTPSGNPTDWFVLRYIHLGSPLGSLTNSSQTEASYITGKRSRYAGHRHAAV
jgi:hypothetical protein